MDPASNVHAAHEESWAIIIQINETSGSSNSVLLGKAWNASDGKDTHDLPEPPAPPQSPYILSWLQTPYPVPFNTLREEYKNASTTTSVWNLSILWVPTTGNTTTTTITLTWDPTIIAAHASTANITQNTTLLANMLTTSSYTYHTNGSLATFLITTINTQPTTGPSLLLITTITIITLILIVSISLILLRRKRK
jgi:hypothetical protein